MESHQWPPHFLDLKREIIHATEKDRLMTSWADLLQEMAKRTEEIAQQGPDVGAHGIRFFPSSVYSAIHVVYSSSKLQRS